MEAPSVEKNLLIVPSKKIVQAWCATFWKKGEESVLLMTFEKVPGGSLVDIVPCRSAAA
jgi:hypothetical protein